MEYRGRWAKADEIKELQMNSSPRKPLYTVGFTAEEYEKNIIPEGVIGLIFDVAIEN